MNYDLDRVAYGERLMILLASLGRHSAVSDHPTLKEWKFLQIGGWGLAAQFGDGWVRLQVPCGYVDYPIAKGRLGREHAAVIASEVCRQPTIFSAEIQRRRAEQEAERAAEAARVLAAQERRAALHRVAESLGVPSVRIGLTIAPHEGLLDRVTFAHRFSATQLGELLRYAIDLGIG